MKLIILTISTIFFTFGSIAQESQEKVKWYTIEEALELNKDNPRKIMIDVYTDWCGWCKKMDATTFNHPVVARYLNENYYPVKFNAETRETVTFKGKTYENNSTGSRPTHDFAIALLNGKMGYPSVAYIDEDLNLLGAVPGYKTAADMELILNYIASEKFKTMKMEEYQASFVSKIQ